MNDYEFGRLMYSYGYVAQMRREILSSIRAGEGACAAVNGFVSVMRERECKSGVEMKFLKDFDKALRR